MVTEWAWCLQVTCWCAGLRLPLKPSPLMWCPFLSSRQVAIHCLPLFVLVATIDPSTRELTDGSCIKYVLSLFDLYPFFISAWGLFKELFFVLFHLLCIYDHCLKLFSYLVYRVSLFCKLFSVVYFIALLILRFTWIFNLWNAHEKCTRLTFAPLHFVEWYADPLFCVCPWEVVHRFCWAGD